MPIRISDIEDRFDVRTPASWLEDAQNTLTTAKCAASNQGKARHAMEAAELALKGLLIKRNLFADDDLHHNLKQLFEKLRQNGAFQSPDRAEMLVDKIEPVEAYDETQDETIYICNVAQGPYLRYPLKQGLEITDSMAQEKYDAAEELLGIVKREVAP